MAPSRGFADDELTAEYYDRRAPDFDDWYLGVGRFGEQRRPGWAEELSELVALIERLAPARTLDVACGTGFLTRHLRGLVVGVDQSPAMVEIAQSRLPEGLALIGDALDLPFPAGAFDRVFTGHFYGHLPADERAAFLAQARRVASTLVVVDAAARPGIVSEQWQERMLNDGSRRTVFKRYFSPGQLAGEIGGEELFAGDWFVAAQAA